MPPLDDSYSFRSIPRRPPQVPHVSFPPSTCHFYYKRFRVVIGLRLVLQPYPRLQPVNDFCSSGQRFALGLVGSPNPASFRFHLTMDTLAFGYVLPTTGRTPDLHRLETCAAGRTTNRNRRDLTRRFQTKHFLLPYGTLPKAESFFSPGNASFKLLYLSFLPCQKP